MTQDIDQGELVTVGNSTQLSFHQLQDIYNALTGKTESLSKRLSKAFRVKFEDLEQLHVRIAQCCNSYGARVKNESVSVFHINGQKEVFSSFDRFRVYNKSNISPVENVHIEYHLLIIPSGTDRPKQYKITIDLMSRIGLWEKQPELSIGTMDILNIIGRSPGQLKIDFVDYAAARHFQTQIEEWFDALDFTPERIWLRSLQEMSHWLRTLMPAMSMLIALLGAYSYAGNINRLSFIPSVDFRNAIVIVMFVILAWLWGHIVGRSIEYSVDRIQPISYVSLNRGDEKCIAKWSKQNLKHALISIGGLIVAFSINIFAALAFEKWM